MCKKYAKIILSWLCNVISCRKYFLINSREPRFARHPLGNLLNKHKHLYHNFVPSIIHPPSISKFRVSVSQTGSISGRQCVFRRVPDGFSFGRVCSDTFRVDFRSAEYVPLHPGSIFGRQSVFCRVPGRFPVGRVCSATSRVNFRSAECVPPRPGSIGRASTGCPDLNCTISQCACYKTIGHFDLLC